MRIVINLLMENPYVPSGAMHAWAALIPEIAQRLREDEKLFLLVSPKLQDLFANLGPHIEHIVFPWSNEHQILRTLSEQIGVPLVLSCRDIDILDTHIAPFIQPFKLILHMKTIQAFTAPEQLPFLSRRFRRMMYPWGTRRADAIIVTSLSMRDEIERYLHVPREKIHVVYEAVDHKLFKPAPTGEPNRSALERYGITGPFILFVSSLWRYKNADGLLRAFARIRGKLKDRKLVIVGHFTDRKYAAEIETMTRELGIGNDVIFCGGVPHKETPLFYQAADLYVNPSLNETFGLPILEAMASGCPTIVSNVSSLSEIAGAAALKADPTNPDAITEAILKGLTPGNREQLIRDGLVRAAQFTWGASAEKTLEVFREVYRRSS